MRPKDGLDAKIQTGTFILSEKIDDTKTKKSEKELKKEMKKLEKEKLEQEKKEKKAREKEKERERQAKRDSDGYYILYSTALGLPYLDLNVDRYYKSRELPERLCRMAVYASYKENSKYYLWQLNFVNDREN
ncbi:hypothetical protein KGM_208216 [Danaus plexippus plexippus]|uniref:Uncharacterized protein n=1 Tax=Danaus plexippus plexippus TaxID=278856 RepID=A0A212FEA5_DANPL|nr:hypothetical protein KGM_208216 [Danaus plexippus plexippus]